MTNSIKTEVCIVGGGPGGLVLGHLLAREGVDVVVLEKSGVYAADREFRGNSLTAGCVAMLQNVGLLDDMDIRQYRSVDKMVMCEGDEKIFEVDFQNRGYAFDYGWMDLPQEVLLTAMAARISRHPSAQVLAGARFEGLIEEDGQVVGIRAQTGGTVLDVRARLIVGADGRYSKVRKAGGFKFRQSEYGRDVVWFKVRTPMEWGNVAKVAMQGNEHLAILPTYPDLLRVAFRIPKGGYKSLRNRGIDSFHREVERLEPSFKGLIQEGVTDWKDTSLLDIITVDVEDWARDGLVLIGDASQTFSPILGQGVNIAILDAFGVAPAIIGSLKQSSNGPLMADNFVNYQRESKKHKAFVGRMQSQQEWMLSLKSPLMVKFRRGFMRLRDRMPAAKKRLASKLFFNQYKSVGRSRNSTMSINDEHS